ncbi:hypothetical protein [Campylobacter curvus]|uniref:hypothetical protein n=1 Tax=Campylobacter curvus TaxID=200 RepID=UPI00146FDADC|nr:hypothetical protein [Campylobacter curvus]
MTQKDFVISAMLKNGKFATLSQLYHLTDVGSWRSKTPFASIRRIVQTNDDFFKIEPGLWGLSEFKDEILACLNAPKSKDDKQNLNEWSHSYYQGIIAQIGNLRHFQTYVPPQDKNRLFVDKKLCEITTLDQIYKFSFENIVARAKNVDVIWFNERNLPSAFFEVEHSTDFKSSLNKFYELQDFNAKMFIVADKNRRAQFNDIIAASIYRTIAPNVRFADYESIVKQYEIASVKIGAGI